MKMLRVILLLTVLPLVSQDSDQFCDNVELMRFDNLQNVLMMTIPKTGTQLLKKFLETSLNEKIDKHIQTLKKRTVYWAHEWKIASESLGVLEPNYNKIKILQDSDVKLVLLLRDPRQHVIALLRAIKKPINSKTIEWGIKNFPQMLKIFTRSSCFLKYKDITECYEKYLEWLAYANVYVASFEKLVGPKGGGTEEAQIQEIQDILQFLGQDISLEKAKVIAGNLFGGTFTFKEGKIDTWKKYYSAANKALFKRVAGDLLIKLGYEKDNNW